MNFSCLLSRSREDHWYHTTSCPMSRLFVQRKSWWKLRILLLQPIQPTLLPPMLQRISLLPSLLAIESRIQRTMQPMFVQPKRRMCFHSTMGTSNHLRMPRQMPPPWTQVQWKHCRPKQLTPIRCLLPRCHCWMYRLPQRITIQREMERLFVQRTLQDRARALIIYLLVQKRKNKLQYLQFSKYFFHLCLPSFMALFFNCKSFWRPLFLSNIYNK